MMIRIFLKLFLILNLVMITGCSRQEVFVIEHNEIINATVEDINNEQHRCFLIVGRDDKYTESLSKHISNAVKIKSEKIYRIYYDQNREEILTIVNPKKLPTLYALDGNTIIDKIEYYDEKDIEGMDTVREVEYTSNIRSKITQFIEKNKNIR